MFEDVLMPRLLREKYSDEAVAFRGAFDTGSSETGFDELIGTEDNQLVITEGKARNDNGPIGAKYLNDVSSKGTRQLDAVYTRITIEQMIQEALRSDSPEKLRALQRLERPDR